MKFERPKPVLILRPMNALGTGGGPAGVVLSGGTVGLLMLAAVSGEVGAVESSGGDRDPLEGVAPSEGGVNGVAPADDGAAFSSEVVVGGEKTGVVLGADSAEAKADFAGVAADASGDVGDFPPKTLDPVPLPNVVSPPVFHAGTDSAVVEAACPNADGPLEAKAPKAPPPLIVEVASFVSAGFEPLKVVGPPDANALNAPPPPKDGDVVLTGVTMGVVDMGVPSPVFPNAD